MSAGRRSPLHQQLVEGLDRLKAKTARQRVYGVAIEVTSGGLELLAGTHEWRERTAAGLRWGARFLRESRTARALAFKWCIAAWPGRVLAGPLRPEWLLDTSHWSDEPGIVSYDRSFIRALRSAKVADLVAERWGPLPIGVRNSGDTTDLDRLTPKAARAIVHREVHNAERRAAEAATEVSPDVCFELANDLARRASHDWFPFSFGHDQLALALWSHMSRKIATFAPFITGALEKRLDDNLIDILKAPHSRALRRDTAVTARLKRLLARTRSLKLAGALTNLGFPSPDWDDRGRLTNLAAFLEHR